MTAFLTTVIWATTAFAPIPESPEPPVVLETAITDECILYCNDGPFYCAETDHDAWDAGSGYNAGWGEGGRHAIGSRCWPGTCQEEHPCGLAFHFEVVDYERLRVALLAADGPAARAALATLGPSAAKFNARRSAIQLIGCNGDVVAHLPVTQIVAASLLAVD